MPTETLTKKVMSFCDVKNILIDALGLDDDAEITEDTKVKKLGADPVDILDVYYRMGMSFTNYTSGEKLSNKGKRVLYRIAELKRRRKDSDGGLHFSDLGNSKTTNEFINQLTVSDLLEIQNYEARNK